MKFDTPATTNPIDQLKIIGHSTSRIDGPLKTTGKATYAYEWHDVFSTPAYGYIVGSAIAKGRIDVDRCLAGEGRVGRHRHRHRRERRKARQGQVQHGEASRRPRDRSLPSGGRRRRRRDLRAGPRRPQSS